MNPETLRVGLYFLGSLLVFVGGMDDALTGMSLPALGLVSASIAKVLAMAGTGILGYARTAKTLGDFSIRDAIGEQLKQAAEPKPEQK